MSINVTPPNPEQRITQATGEVFTASVMLLQAKGLYGDPAWSPLVASEEACASFLYLYPHVSVDTLISRLVDAGRQLRTHAAKERER